jgi:hypothetical protein
MEIIHKGVTMSQTNHGSIEWLRFPNPEYPGDNTKLIKKWLRDSWARRKILALQQTIAAIVVPTKTSQLTNDSGFITQADVPPVPSPSTVSPKMDGTASAGSSGAWSRGDHVHPHDTSKADKATTLSGYGITNAYTKTEVDGMIPTVPTSVSVFTNDVGYLTATGGALTFNDTAYNLQYVSSASGTWQRVGDIVIFNVQYTMAANISALLADVFKDMPRCNGIRHFLSESTTREVTARHVSVSGTSLNIAGAHTSGNTYYASGAYLTSA